MIIQSSKVLNHNEGLISQKKICSHSRKLRQLCGGCPDFFFIIFPIVQEESILRTTIIFRSSKFYQQNSCVLSLKKYAGYDKNGFN